MIYHIIQYIVTNIQPHCYQSTRVDGGHHSTVRDTAGLRETACVGVNSEFATICLHKFSQKVQAEAGRTLLAPGGITETQRPINRVGRRSKPIPRGLDLGDQPVTTVTHADLKLAG